MSAPHSRLFETSLSALLLADREEAEAQPTVRIPGEQSKPMGVRNIDDGIPGGSPCGYIVS
jgi:hypothetical protein